MAKPIPVLEIFGPTVQGEGWSSAKRRCLSEQPAVTIRAAGAIQLYLGRFGEKDIKWMTAEEVYESLKDIGGNAFSHVTISGGNPALLKQLDGLISL